MLTTFLRRSLMLCLALSLAVGFAAAGGGSSSIRTANQTATSTGKQKAKSAGVSSTTQGDSALRARANRLHSQSIVIDTHNDITSPLLDNGFDLAMRGDDPKAKIKTHTDLRRMKAGGLGAEFFAVYVGK